MGVRTIYFYRHIDNLDVLAFDEKQSADCNSIEYLGRMLLDNYIKELDSPKAEEFESNSKQGYETKISELEEKIKNQQTENRLLLKQKEEALQFVSNFKIKPQDVLKEVKSIFKKFFEVE